MRTAKEIYDEEYEKLIPLPIHEIMVKLIEIGIEEGRQSILEIIDPAL